jgi:hypothetical protein
MNASATITSVALVGHGGQKLIWVNPPCKTTGEIRAKRRLEHAAQDLGIPGPYSYEVIRLASAASYPYNPDPEVLL